MARTVATRGGVTRGQYSFAQVPSASIPRSVFDRSCGHKTAIDSGYIYPIFVDEALPGDTMNMRMASFARLTTPKYPVMDNMFMDFFFFAVPMRLLWENWERFNGAQDDPGDSTAFTMPAWTGQTVVENSLSDYLGIPPGTSLDFNCHFHRAYNLIWREWFRDENLQDSPVVDLTDAAGNLSDYVLLKRGKRHDYFTSCLPWTQKGLAVELPLGSTAPVLPDGSAPTFQDNASVITGEQLNYPASGTNVQWNLPGTGAKTVMEWDDPHLYADLTTATAATINEIREAFQVQKLLERDARGGTRYTEIVRSHFGVVSADQRLQRPEYLGGGSTRININPVASTVFVTGQSAVGQLGAFGVGVDDQVGFVKSFTEHCVVMGLVNIRADITYQQGLERHFSREDRFDFYWPSLAMLGEQAVLSKEIYCDGTGADENVFGYQERYAEYRYKPSRVSGPLRTSATGAFDAWHLALDFGARPTLNSSFIEDAPPISRVVISASDPEFICDFFFAFRCVRPMPTYSVPGLIDHF